MNKTSAQFGELEFVQGSTGPKIFWVKSYIIINPHTVINENNCILKIQLCSTNVNLRCRMLRGNEYCTCVMYSILDVGIETKL